MNLRVFSNSAMSADGKIATWRKDLIDIGSPEDQRFMSELRARADAVVVGGQTFRNWRLPLVEDPAHLPWVRTRDRPVINAVLTRSGVASRPPDPGVFPDPRVQVLVFGAPGIDRAAHGSLFGAEVLERPDPDVRWVVSELAARGCRSVLVEGGGAMIFQFLEADLLDEMYVTVAPLIIGGAESPSPVDGRGFDADALRRLQLLSARHVGDEMFLHYRVRRAAVAGAEGEGAPGAV